MVLVAELHLLSLLQVLYQQAHILKVPVLVDQLPHHSYYQLLVPRCMLMCKGVLILVVDMVHGRQ